MRLLLLFPLLALPLQAEEAPAPEAPLRPVVSEIASLQAGEAPAFVGTVTARNEADLGFPMIGTVAERLVDIGDAVAQGAVLARLDPEDLEADLRAAEAGVIVARARLRAATDAEARARELAARGVDSATRVEDAQRALTAAQAQLEQAQAARARAEDMRALATLRAPRDGVVTEVFAEPGATLSAGQPVVRLAGTDLREVVIDLPEPEVARLQIGNRFDAVLAARPAVTAGATLTRIDPVAERATRTRRLYLALDDPPDGFRLGALVRVRPQDSTEAGVAVPLSAVLDAGGAPAVWGVDRATDTVHRRAVTLGERFGDYVRIAEGVTPGEEVLVKGIHSVTDGQKVGPRVTR